MRNFLPLSLVTFHSRTPLTVNPTLVAEVGESVPYSDLYGESLVVCRPADAKVWACVLTVKGREPILVLGNNEEVTAKWRAALTGLDAPAERLLNAVAALLASVSTGKPHTVPIDHLNPMLDPIYAEAVEAAKAVRLALP